ncbi:MAG: propionyl-CoA synthetase [Aliidiomarina sp.]|uniref:propionyl-CoA synthetase n=1 Tax=Aliidiomarina sp. TaxID=1872439 RepID=UPI0025C60D64|nr:propionyl-CoA synthetase [Aliidiomarina sp.]MCH8500403.1 propionyl-CoA synthetase [Aliidiomarina sp.]
MSYQLQHQESIGNPEQYWRRQASKLAWYQQPSQILTYTDSDDLASYQWFADGELNLSYLTLDYHIEHGRGDQVAIYYDSPVTGTQTAYTYTQLRDEVARFAGVLQKHGVSKGDRVVIYMPMIPQAAIAMLAVARLGAIHSVVFGGFAAHELAVRIDDAQPKVVVSASHGIEPHRLVPYKPLLDKAIEKAEFKPQASIIYQRQHVPADKQVTLELQAGFDFDWQTEMRSAQPVAPVAVKSTDPLYILYTSGTTGKPKGVVRDSGGYATALHFSMQAVYNLKPGDTMFTASDVGWVVGHSYIVYGPLLLGCSTVLYEGKPVFTPDAGAFWRIAEQYQAKVIFAAPTAFRAIRKEDPNGEFLKHYDLSSVETIFMAGERLDPATYEWAQAVSGKPVVDHWWQTESGWPICANPTGIEALTTKVGSSSVPVPGYQVQVLDDLGEPVLANQQGNIVIQLPLPPGCLAGIWQSSERFRSSYLQQFPGYYSSGDGGYIDEDGYVFIMGRTDDVINVAGHRLSTGEMEEVVASHPAVAECCVIGAQDSLKGQQPLGLVIMKNGVELSAEQLEKELVAVVREEIGALACFKTVVVVKRLPKTRSGKILRKIVRQIADDQPYQTPSTIDDPDSLNEIAEALAKRSK